MKAEAPKGHNFTKRYKVSVWVSQHPYADIPDEYFEEIFGLVRNAMEMERIEVLTICLSPEMCGDWSAAENMCRNACELLNLDFKLPNTTI